MQVANYEHIQCKQMWVLVLSEYPKSIQRHWIDIFYIIFKRNHIEHYIFSPVLKITIRKRKIISKKYVNETISNLYTSLT